MCRAVPTLPQCVFMAWYLIKHRDNFAFTSYFYHLLTKPRHIKETHFVNFIVPIYEGVSKSFRTGRLERELQIIQFSATRCSFIAIL
jgi:hypothetical protein